MPGRDSGNEHRGSEGLRHGSVLYDRRRRTLQAGARTVNGVTLPRPLFLWLLRAAWITLPVTAGPAAGSAIDAWADAPRVAAAVLLWLAWGVGLLATLAPRPQTLTALRVIAPAFVVVAVLATIEGSASTLAIVGALLATVVCSALASGHDIASAAANALAYGDEQRFPLRVPPALFLGPLPLARLLVAGGVVAPVLLLAEGEIVIGAVALVVGIALVFLLSRSLESLSRRWAVLVPAGFVVVDPLTLADPTLFLREHVRHVAPEPPAAGDARHPRPAPRGRRGLGVGGVRRGDRAGPCRARTPRRRDGHDRRDPGRAAAARRDAPPGRGSAAAGADPGQVAIPPPTSASPA